MLWTMVANTSQNKTQERWGLKKPRPLANKISLYKLLRFTIVIEISRNKFDTIFDESSDQFVDRICHPPKFPEFYSIYLHDMK